MGKGKYSAGGLSRKEKEMKMKAFVLIMLALFLSPAFASGDEALIAAAKKEGKVVLYTSSNPTDLRPLFDAFKKRYPFMNPQSYDANCPELAEKFLAEERAGKHLADVIACDSWDTERFKKENLVARYIPPSAKNFASRMKDPEGYWATDNYTFWVLGYNKNFVKEKDLPRDWFDLVDPKWQGKVAVHLLAHRLYAGWEQRWGQEKARQLVEGLKKQKLLLRKGWSQIPRLLAAGEYPLAVAFVHHIEQVKTKGAPVDWVKTFDPLIANIRGVAVSAKAPNPNAARLFSDFYLSKESQQIIANTWGKVPGNPDVQSPYSAYKDLKVFPIDGKLMIANDEHYKKVAKEVFWK
jgi:iron(III) transport system substrate-binding protein